jgi:PAS domain S-box-containing protein
MRTASIRNGSVQESVNHSNEHNVQLYVDDRHLNDVLSEYIGRALAAGERGVVVATSNHRRELSRRLLTQKFDLKKLTRQGQCVMLDAAEILSLFMARGHIDEQLFPSGVKTVFERVNQFNQGTTQQTRIFGEIVGLLWAAGKPEDAIRFETLWNCVAKDQSFSTLCAYPMMGFYNERDLELFVRICGEHSRLFLSNKVYNDAAPTAAPGPPDDSDFRKDLASHEADLRFQLLVEAAKERAVFMIDLDGRISSWNPGAESIHGYAANEVVGRRLSFLDNEEDRPHDGFASKLAAAIHKGPVEEEYWRTRKDGSRFLATFTISPATNESGKLIGFSETVRLSRKIQNIDEPESFLKRTCRTLFSRRRSVHPQTPDV